MATFAINARNPGRFGNECRDDFVIDVDVTNGPPSLDEKDYKTKVDAFGDRLAQEYNDIIAPQQQTSLLRGKRDEILLTIRDLKVVAAWIKDVAADPTKKENIAKLEYRYEHMKNRLEDDAFLITLIKDGEMAIDLSLDVRRNGVGIDTGDARLKLFEDILRTCAVIRAACRAAPGEASRFWSMVGLWGVMTRKREAETAWKRATLNAYMRKLDGYARAGLLNGKQNLAAVGVAQLQTEFRDEVSAVVKNGYLFRLALPVFFALCLSSLISFAWAQSHRAFDFFWLGGFAPKFAIAAAGAVMGMWLSFSIRREQFEFFDLAVIEKDLLDPVFRTLFVLGLTLVVCLLFATGAVNFDVGALHTAVFLSNDNAPGSGTALLKDVLGVDWLTPTQVEMLKSQQIDLSLDYRTLTQKLAALPIDAAQKLKLEQTASTWSADRTVLPTAKLTSLLVGALCGLSERALAVAVSGRSASFVQAIGTTKP